MSTEVKNLIGARLAGYAPLVALVGNRIGPVEAEEDSELPHVVFFQFGGRSERTYKGEAEQEIEIEIDCVAATYTVAQAVANVVETVMRGVEVLGDRRVEALDRDDMYDPGTERHYVVLQYQIWWNRRA